jgi:hypothetical protein
MHNCVTRRARRARIFDAQFHCHRGPDEERQNPGAKGDEAR